ncbi:sulfonate transport system substrate-binding protein [Sinosporangium album]|uniref:Sulfonate transport system substrate-binding protein n=1 Tax=Sinosporangium album TaxID=504805 RepID=A0A1G7T589_9ACTN|nr:ABC transporter substrate-binding protein [Sinosporangium album]SDG30483.1 sulfonate transport system substrate-binding protein [Sinosporangium album]
MTIRIGVHANNPFLFLLSHLDHLLQGQDEPIEVYRYTDGTRTGDLLAEGAFDIGGTGSTPPLSAQAAGLPVVYVAASAPRPGHGALLVAKDGPVVTVADLAGQPVSFAVGSWHTHFLAKLLSGAGLSYQDIEPRPAASEAGLWLRDGAIAGWVVQGAELVEAERSGRFARLAGTAGVIADRSVFFTSREVAERRPEAIATVAKALREAAAWAGANPREAAALTASERGGSIDAWETALKRLPWTLEPVTSELLAEQQEGADLLADVGFLRRAIDVRTATAPVLNTLVSSVLAEVAV